MEAFSRTRNAHLLHCDTDSSGKISVAQFIQGVATFTGGDVDRRLQMIFRTVDTDQTGLVSHDELLKLLRTKRRCGGLSALLPLIISVSFNGIETFVAVLSTSQVAGVQAMGSWVQAMGFLRSR